MNRKQEKRFWSADQKRFVYSLKAAGIGISAAAFKVLHKSLSQKSGICYTVTEVLSDGRKDFEIGRET